MMLTPNQVSINYFMDQLNIQLKVCSKCNLNLSFDNFHKHPDGKYGLQSRCKSCRAEHYQDNKAEIREQQKEYYRDNKAEIAEHKKEYRKNNPDKIKAGNKANQERNRTTNLKREKTSYFEDIKDNPKRCSRCKQTKTCADFGRDITTPDGLKATCKDCDIKRSINYVVNRDKNDPNFKLVRKFKWAFSISLKQGELIRSLKTLMKKAGIKSIQELTGVKTIQMARKMLLKTMPQGYTEQDWIDKLLHIDHREPLSYFLRLHGDNLKLALIQANQITNLRLIEAKENLRKHSSYALMPDNTELLYEDWVKTKGIKING